MWHWHYMMSRDTDNNPNTNMMTDRVRTHSVEFLPASTSERDTVATRRSLWLESSTGPSDRCFLPATWTKCKSRSRSMHQVHSAEAFPWFDNFISCSWFYWFYCLLLMTIFLLMMLIRLILLCRNVIIINDVLRINEW